MMNGVQFNEIHSYHDLGLIMSECIVHPAQPKTNYIEVPFGNGSIDLSEANGEIKFSDRTLDFIFSVKPCNFEEKKTEVSNTINGLKCKITLDKDNEYYYSGRVSVNEHASEKNIGKIVVSAVCHPFKFKEYETVKTFKSILQRDHIVDTIVDKKIDITSGNVVDAEGYLCTSLITVCGYYTLYWWNEQGTDGLFTTAFYDKNRNLISVRTDTVPSDSTLTFDTPINTVYMRTSFLQGGLTHVYDDCIDLSNGRLTVTPRIMCTEETEMKFAGNTYTLSPGTQYVLPITLTYGMNLVGIKTTGNVEFTYQEGDL